MPSYKTCMGYQQIKGVVAVFHTFSDGRAALRPSYNYCLFLQLGRMGEAQRTHQSIIN